MLQVAFDVDDFGPKSLVVDLASGSSSSDVTSGHPKKNLPMENSVDT